VFKHQFQNPAALAHARYELTEKLRQRGITDESVLRAIGQVPREEFIPPAFQHRAYDDDALPIECGQTISQPYTVAYMSQLLEARPDMNVLEIGTGSGYQAAVLWYMGLRVFTVERHEELLMKARERFDRLGCSIASHLGDGTLGWSRFAPYDRIIVTAGAPDVPSSLLKQLAPDGRLVIPVGSTSEVGSQRMQVAIRLGDRNEYDLFDYGDFKFVPLVGRKGWEDPLIFRKGSDNRNFPHGR
jgi:protein-L-isoaspartate(D-aspartate) O-methyltransferase